MILVSFRHTMASAKQIVPDHGINLRPAKPRFFRGPRIRFVAPPQPRDLMAGIPKHARLLIEAVAFWHGIEPRQIVASGTSMAVSAARHDAVAAVYANCTGPAYTLEGLSRIFRRDHSTIRHSLKRRGLL